MDITEAALLDAAALRVARIDGNAPYATAVTAPVLKQRIDFDSFLDSMPLLGVVVHTGEYQDQGDSPRYPVQETTIEFVGCLRATSDSAASLAMLADMKRAIFDNSGTAAGDALTGCSVIRPIRYNIFLAANGEEFTQISFFISARWDDDALWSNA
jgi:hypothetical protein